MKKWEYIKCYSCSGHGIYAHYSMYDFEGPEECRDCSGSGQLIVYKKSGTLAAYPGGPFCGKVGKNEND